MSKIGKYEFLLDIIITFLLLWLFQFTTYMRKYLAAYLILQYLCGRYKSQKLLIWDEVTLLMKTHIFYFVFCFFIAIHQYYTFNYLTRLAIMVILSFILTSFSERSLHIWLQEDCKCNVLIFGIGNTAKEISDIIKGNRFSMMDIQAFVDCNELNYRIQEQKADQGKTISFHELDSFLNENQIDNAIFAIPEIDKEELKILTQAVNDRISNISLIPRVEGTISFNTSIKNLDGIILVNTSIGTMSLFDKACKRIFDICAGLAGTIVCVPLIGFVYLLNRKCNDNGPVLFVQKRIGLNGKEFNMYKFRTMIIEADTILDDLLNSDPDLKREYEINKKLHNDPRITKAGAFLRKTSLDEFPQFVNVLKGEMSMIGPRPYLPREIKDMGSHYQTIIKSKPGITGMWQTHGRNETDFNERLELDEYYYRNWNIWLDVELLIRTFKTVSKHIGAK